MTAQVVPMYRAWRNRQFGEEVWLCSGVTKRYRVGSAGRTYGEWDSRADAEQFLALLLAGNPDTLRKLA